MNAPSDMLTVLRTSAHDLRAIPDATVHAIITSPPYYGLRAYSGEQDVEWPTVEYRLNEWTEPITVQGCDPDCNHEWVLLPPRPGGAGNSPDKPSGFQQKSKAGQTGALSQMKGANEHGGRYCAKCGGWRGPLGLEPSPVAFVGHLILCLREWKRVLRDEGVCFVNLGDSYASSGGPEPVQTANANRDGGSDTMNGGRSRKIAQGLKPKDLLGIPFMFAFAARADGWYLRSAIPWIKRNAMPGSQQDRPTNSHEYWFLLAKNERYFYDQEAVKLPVAPASKADGRTSRGARGTTGEYAAIDGNCGFDPAGRTRRTADTFFDSLQAILDGANGMLQGDDGEPLALVVNPQGYAGAHYAVFPTKLIEPLVRASTSERGCCATCGAPWKRVVGRNDVDQKANETVVHNGVPGLKAGTAYDRVRSLSGATYQYVRSATLGWLPTCDCYGIHIPDDLFDVIEKPEDAVEPGDACDKCEGLGYLPGPPLMPDMTTTCSKCKGKQPKQGNKAYRDWQAAVEARQAAQIELLAQVGEDATTVPCTTLDPFSGSGTTAAVSIKLGRRSIAVDMSDEYLTDHVLARTTVQMEML